MVYSSPTTADKAVERSTKLRPTIRSGKNVHDVIPLKERDDHTRMTIITAVMSVRDSLADLRLPLTLQREVYDEVIYIQWDTIQNYR